MHFEFFARFILIIQACFFTHSPSVSHTLDSSLPEGAFELLSPKVTFTRSKAKPPCGGRGTSSAGGRRVRNIEFRYLFRYAFSLTRLRGSVSLRLMFAARGNISANHAFCSN